MKRHNFLCLIAFLVAIQPAQATAQDAAASPAEAPQRATTARAILLWGPSDSAEGSARAREALEARLDPSEGFPERILAIADWTSEQDLQLGGSSKTVSCRSDEGLPIAGPEAELSTWTARGRQALDNLDLEGAARAFAMAEKLLPCQRVFVKLESLWETHFYNGISTFYAGNEAGGAEQFRLAAAIAPRRPWDPSYPPEPQSTYLSAVQDVVSRPRGRVYGDLRGSKFAEVWLNGEQLDGTKAFETSLPPGQHLIQVVDTDGNWSTYARQVKEGSTLTLFSRKGLEETLLEGPDGVLGNVAASTLTHRSREERLFEIYLVTLDNEAEGDVARVLRYSPRIGAWARLELTDTGEVSQTVEQADISEAPAIGEEEPHPLLRKPDYRTSASVGFKALQIHRCTEGSTDADGHCPSGHRSPNGYFGGLIGIDIRLVGGLNLDIRFGALLTDLSLGGNLLPELSLGIRYRFLTGPVQPFAAVAGDLMVGTVRESRYEEPLVVLYGGLLGSGGVDFEAPDGFRITLEGGAGALIRPEGSDGAWPMGYGMLSLGRFMP